MSLPVNSFDYLSRFGYPIYALLGYCLFSLLIKGSSRRIRFEGISQKFFPSEVFWTISTSVVIAGTVFFLNRFDGLRMRLFSQSDMLPDAIHFGVSFIALVILYDAYFYWLHFFLHRTSFFRFVHYLHHKARNPTSWSSFSLHPIEAILIVPFSYITKMTGLLDPSAIYFFVPISIAHGVMLHCGLEFFSDSFKVGRIGRWIVTPRYHSVHHQSVHYNLGGVFRFWDKIMKTDHPHNVV